MPRIALTLLFCVGLAGQAAAQDEMSARLSQERIGEVQPGTYNAGGRSFTLDRYDDKFLMRLSGDPEVYVLYADHAPLGGRALKYDSGGAVIAVATWGSMTLYTDQAPGGVPAERTGDSIPPSLGLISLGEVQNAADDEAQHLAYSRGIHLAFVADWSALAGDSRMRAICFDAMENAARGIDRFVGKPAGRNAFAKKIDQVRISVGTKPVLFLSGKTLNVTFNAQRGYAGRASSRGIARALGELLQVPVPN